MQEVQRKKVMDTSRGSPVVRTVEPFRAVTIQKRNRYFTGGFNLNDPQDEPIGNYTILDRT